MDLSRCRSRLLAAFTGGLTVPRLAKLGALVIVVGLGLDVTVHTVLHSIHDELIGAFPLKEHFAHLVVLVGMVIVLAGVMSDGLRTPRRPVRQEASRAARLEPRRGIRQKGSPRHAIR
jgi:hypothetical protein